MTTKYNNVYIKLPSVCVVLCQGIEEEASRGWHCSMVKGDHALQEGMLKAER